MINLPTSDLVEVVVEIGNTSGAKIDKFQKFSLTAVPGDKVDAPRIEECYAKFECRLADGRLISKYGFFIWEVVKAHVAVFPKYPKTLHYRDDGVFMISGGSLNRRRIQTAESLIPGATEASRKAEVRPSDAVK